MRHLRGPAQHSRAISSLRLGGFSRAGCAKRTHALRAPTDWVTSAQVDRRAAVSRRVSLRLEVLSSLGGSVSAPEWRLNGRYRTGERSDACVILAELGSGPIEDVRDQWMPAGRDGRAASMMRSFTSGAVSKDGVSFRRTPVSPP